MKAEATWSHRRIHSLRANQVHVINLVLRRSLTYRTGIMPAPGYEYDLGPPKSSAASRKQDIRLVMVTKICENDVHGSPHSFADTYAADMYRGVFDFAVFNAVQSSCFPVVSHRPFSTCNTLNKLNIGVRQLGERCK